MTNVADAFKFERAENVLRRNPTESSETTFKITSRKIVSKRLTIEGFELSGSDWIPVMIIGTVS